MRAWIKRGLKLGNTWEKAAKDGTPSKGKVQIVGPSFEQSVTS